VGADLDELRQRVCHEVDRRADELIDLSHDIHAHPELCFEEHHAHGVLTGALERAGLPTTRGAYGLDTAFEARLGSPEGPTVALLCEYDALPGLGHACGHNIIAAAGLGAGLAAATVVEELGGELRILGTPAEEGGGGKIEMARRGALDGLDVAMMVHPADADLLFMDTLAIRRLDIVYEGVASHAAAAPQEGRNALDAAVLGYLGVGTLRQHIRPTERVHGIFTEGGEQANIVPRRAAMQWYVRSDDVDSLEPLCERVVAALQAGAAACGCTAHHTWLPNGYADLRSNGPLARAYASAAARLGRVVADPAVSGHHVVGSTDMGNVSYLVPSIHPMVRAAPPGTPIHTERFAEAAASVLGDRAVVDGAKALAMAAVAVWSDAALRREIRDDFGVPADAHRVLSDGHPGSG
jgi:amidohydrolase